MVRKLCFAALFGVCLGFAPKSLGSVPELIVPYAAKQPVIDGMRSFAEWEQTAVIDRLLPPTNVQPDARWKKCTTRIYLSYDEDFLYVLFLCRDGELFTRTARRDDRDLFRQDVCEIFLDPVGDARMVVELQLSPRNVLFDQLILLTAPPQYGPDGRLTDAFFFREAWRLPQWDYPGLKTATGIWKEKDETVGWLAEWAIPAKALLQRLGTERFSPGMRIRAQFCRYDYQPDRFGGRQQIFSYWTKILNGCPHTMPGHMGELVFLKPQK